MAVALVLTLAAAQGAEAQRKTVKPVAPVGPPGAARNGPGGIPNQDTGPTLPRALVEKQVSRLTDEIDWMTSLDEAKDRAKKENKPIFWVHALGVLDGEC
jgi:hypothetical protein